MWGCSAVLCLKCLTTYYFLKLVMLFDANYLLPLCIVLLALSFIFSSCKHYNFIWCTIALLPGDSVRSIKPLMYMLLEFFQCAPIYCGIAPMGLFSTRAILLLRTDRSLYKTYFSFPIVLVLVPFTFNAYSVSFYFWLNWSHISSVIFSRHILSGYWSVQ